MCHCRYCQTYTGSAFGTQVWFPEDKVTLTSGELSIYENNTESGIVVTLNFCKNCGSTIFLRLNVFKVLLLFLEEVLSLQHFGLNHTLRIFVVQRHHLFKLLLLKSTIHILCITRKRLTITQLNNLLHEVN